MKALIWTDKNGRLKKQTFTCAEKFNAAYSRIILSGGCIETDFLYVIKGGEVTQAQVDAKFNQLKQVGA
jgi:hypothetical protein